MIENLLEVGRHFQKTSYEKEVEGEKQASIKPWKLQNQIFGFENTHCAIEWINGTGSSTRWAPRNRGKIMQVNLYDSALNIFTYSLSPQSLGYIRGGGCERILPWVRSFGYFRGVVLQSEPQVSTSPPSVDILFLVPGWRRLPLESWRTCSAMRRCSWESWRRPGTSRSCWGCWRSRTPPPYPSYSGETNLCS